ncbi:MAG TPA: DUF3347 domain-containing protein [Thermoanaerobaculia bacterium]|nr:DUF3347 domain-containing protein [Thermoanaerobaculia bacterium]
MKVKLFAVLALVAAPLFADTTLFTKYEAVRQGLLKDSLKETQTTAKDLAAAAREAKSAKVAAAAEKVAKSPDIAKARAAFGALSDEMIAVRKAAKGDRPAVAYCPMVDQSWLQEKGEIGNPYDTSMKLCGMFQDDEE